MKKCRRIMAFVAVVLAFAMAFTNVSIPAEAATTTVKSISVTNLPSNTLTLKAGKTFALKTNVAVSKLKFATSNSRIATVTSRGTIKAVKSGKANITVTLKTNATVKKVISVTVGRPVTGVKLNRTTLTLVKGKSAVFRTTVTPANASNKKLVWKSSNTAVLKVSTTGRITGVKAGVAVVTATAADGSGKKAVCKVTVVNPTKVTSVTVTDPLTIKVVLSQAQKLTASNFKLKAATVVNGAFLINIPLTSVTTKDYKTYILKFDDKYMLPIQTRECVIVSGLYGTGTARTETYYSAGAVKETSYKSFVSELNIETEKKVSVNTECYCAFSVSGLPEGIKYKRIPEEYESIRLVGTPTKTGTTISTVVARDELGNVYIVKVKWNVYSDSVISASYVDGYYGINAANPVVNVSSQISVGGGSGSYTYAIVGDDYGLSVDSKGKVSGQITKAGTYSVKVKVTDAKNTSISKTVTCVIKTVDEVAVIGTLKSKNGGTLPSWAEITFENKDRSHGSYIKYCTADSNGKYGVSLIPGTYDITIQCGNSFTYLFSQTITKSVENKVYTSNVRKIAVKSNNSQYTVDGIGLWKDENGSRCGLDGYLYLVPGTYKLTASADGSGKCGTITATVTDKTTAVTAKIESDTADFGTGTSVSALAGKYYRFIPNETGTYYFYSVSTSGDPKGFLYDENKSQLASNDDSPNNISDNAWDFCISYSCTAGNTYYIKADKENCRIYVSMNDPRTRR